MSKLDEDMKACERDGYGVSYGKWMAAQERKRMEAEEKPVKRCPQCGKVIASERKNKIFCSNACGALYRYYRKKGVV